MRLALLFSIVFFSTPAGAQWIYQKNEDPFDEKHLHIALTAARGYALGLRCEAGSGNPELVLITPERVEDGMTSVMNLTSPKLVIIIDDKPAKTLDATLTQSDDDKLIIASSDDLVHELAADLASARKRVAAAVEAVGQKFHKSQFGVSGTKRAVGSVVAGCKPKQE